MYVPVKRYRRDTLSGVLTFLGVTAVLTGGLLYYYGSALTGALTAASGAILLLVSGTVHRERTSRKLIEKLKAEGVEEELKKSVASCATVYNACPTKTVLAYLSSLNPQAARLARPRKRAGK